MKSLRHVQLNGNNINVIAPSSFAKLKVIQQIELMDNRLEHLKKDALTTSFMRYEGMRVTQFVIRVEILVLTILIFK